MSKGTGTVQTMAGRLYQNIYDNIKSQPDGDVRELSKFGRNEVVIAHLLAMIAISLDDIHEAICRRSK